MRERNDEHVTTVKGRGSYITKKCSEMAWIRRSMVRDKHSDGYFRDYNMV